MSDAGSRVFLVDVDNTLLDNDRIRDDIRAWIEKNFGAEARDRYWTIEEGLFTTLGYRDYLGAVQQFRLAYPEQVEFVSLSEFLLDYPFADRLYPRALDVLAALGRLGPVVVLSDGDAVFQPRKIVRAGLAAAVDGRVLVYVHKEDSLDDIRRHFPARHYVLVDDKLRILSAFKQAWGHRITTVFPRQGKIARDPDVVKSYPPADVTVERIGDLLDPGPAGLILPQLQTQPMTMVAT